MANDRTFSIVSDWYGDKTKLYKCKSVTIKEGLTVLCGCNGCGKTTLLHQIEQALRSENIPVLTFNNLTDGGDTLTSEFIFSNQMDLAASSICRSEGEKIRQSIDVFAKKMGRFIAKEVFLNNKREVFFLFDSTDSGLSIDNVIDLKQQLFQTVITDCKEKGITPYILIAANEYELVRGEEQCLEVPKLKYRKFSTYESYRKYIIATRKAKNKRDKLDDWDEYD